MHTKIFYLCHNSALSPQIPSLPKLVLADLWRKKKINQTNKPYTEKKPLLVFVYFCCSLLLEEPKLFLQLRELLSHMTSAVASGHLSPSVHAYGCSTVTALLYISQASCSTFLDRGKGSLWLEANNSIPGASKSQAKGQGLGHSLANISSQGSVTWLSWRMWPFVMREKALWGNKCVAVIMGYSRTESQGFWGWNWPLKITVSTPPSAHSGAATVCRFLSGRFMRISKDADSAKFLGNLPGQSVTCL